MRSAVFLVLALTLAGCASWVANPEIDPNYDAQIKAWQDYAGKAQAHKIFEICGTENEPVKIVGKFIYYGNFNVAPPPEYRPPRGTVEIIVDGLVRLAPFGLAGYGLWSQHATYSDFIKAGYGNPAGPDNSVSNRYTFNAEARENQGASSIEWNLNSKNPVDNSATAPPVIVPAAAQGGP